MINNVVGFIWAIEKDLGSWPANVRPWFRGESGTRERLKPKIADYDHIKELYLLQSFRRKAGGLSNTPPREGATDLWLFLAQHYGIKTRLLDWTEGALIALYFAINRREPNPVVFMLNPHKLNSLTLSETEKKSIAPNYPLTWGKDKIGAKYISLAWGAVSKKDGLDLPLAFPAAYQDNRMIAQRSCFTTHGNSMDGLITQLQRTNINISECINTYEIQASNSDTIGHQLSYLGISASTIFPDLDRLSMDINSDIENE